MQEFTNEDIKEKLDYIGLDLENIPEIFASSKEIEYRPLKVSEDNGYRVYKYVPISKIQILLTPTNRLNTIKEKYSKASSINDYLQPKKEEDILKHTTFLKMLKAVKTEEIEEIIKEQEKLNKQIPFKVKFEENYLWQIYYSDIDDTYFMLVPTEDIDYASFFCLLKKQIEYSKTKKEEMIFVPIAYEHYGNEYLKNSEISDIENYLWFFTKNWTNIYDVYDKEGNVSVQIVGETFVYENIKGVYKNKLENKEDALKFYKLLKALFILSTELPHYYKFKTEINEQGSIEFWYNGTNIGYGNMFSILKNNYINAEDEIVSTKKEKMSLEEEIKHLEKLVSIKEQEYLLKEKQIATYLECKKTFFGKVKYFFKSKKMKKDSLKEEQKLEKEREAENKEEQFKGIDKKIDYNKKQNEETEVKINKNEIQTNDNKKVKLECNEKKVEEQQKESFSIKEFYTVEDIIKIYKELDELTKNVKNLRMDSKAFANKIESLELKIKNSNLYIEEIDKHEKNIFEFWKFANKDEKIALNQGTISEKSIKNNIEKVYNYEEDEEEIATTVDNMQRIFLTQKQTDAIYLATTNILQALNNIDNEKTLEESLENLKEENRNQRLLFATDNIDIFGKSNDESIKTNMLGNKKHRETKKDKLKIIDITNDTTIEEYKDKLNEILETIRNSLSNVKNKIGIPVYIATNQKEDINRLQICRLKPEDAINELVESGKINLYRINLKENSKIIYFSNIIYYDNYNKTLPIGMDEQTGCIIDLKQYELKQLKTENFRISNLKDEFNIEVKEVYLQEYDIVEKSNNK